MKAKPDDRRDNVEKIQANINNTIENIRLTEEAIAEADNPKVKEELKAKNERRLNALDSMRVEVKDEARAKERDYK